MHTVVLAFTGQGLSLLNRLVDAISFLIAWALLVAVVCGIAFGLFVYNRADDEIRAYVEGKLADHYAPLTVSLDSARLLERRGIELRGLSIRDVQPDGTATELVSVDTITVACEPTLDDLMKGKLCVRHVTVSHPRFLIACNAQGKWQLGRLLVPPDFCGDSRPILQIVNGVAHIRDERRQSQYTLRDIELTVQHRVTLQQQNLAGSPAATEPQVSPHEHCQLPWRQNSEPKVFQLAASFTGDHLEHTVINGVLQPQEKIWRFKGNVPRMHLSPELRTKLPLEVAQYLDLVPSLRSGGSFGFDVSHHPQRTPTLHYEIDGHLTDGRMDDPRFTFPVTDLQAQVRVSHEELDIRSITGRYGEANVQLSCRRSGHVPRSRWQLEGSVERLRIDRSLAATLPQSAQNTWRNFQPNGLIDAQFQLNFDGLRWHVRHVNVACRKMSVLPQVFPYPLNNMTGEFRWHEDHASFDVSAAASGQPVIVRGEIDSPGEHWTGWVSGRTDGRIALDETLISALQPKVQSVVRSFGAQGWLTAKTEFRRETADAPLEKQLTVDLHDTYVRHHAFPYPLHDVQGRLAMVNDLWQFQDFHGRNDTAHVTCHGSLTPHPAGRILRLDFGVQDLPLDDEIRLALPEKSQAMWNELRPHGHLDHLAATIEQVGDSTPKVRITIREAPTPQGSLTPPLSIHPVTFPYRIEQLTGVAQFADGQLAFERIRGRHGRMGLLISKGHGTVAPNGQWQIKLDDFSADQLEIDHDLLAAVPPRLNRQLVQSRVTGPLSMQGTIAFAGNRHQPGSARTTWDLSVDLDDVGLFAGVTAEHISGTVRLNGGSNRHQFYSQGSLEIDSLVLRDVHVTQLRGPIWIDQERVLFGRWAQPAGSKQDPQPMSAQVFGGQITCDGQSLLDDHGQFQLQVQLADAETNQVLRTVRSRATASSSSQNAMANPLSPKIDGQARANLVLSGSRQGRHTLQGTGVVRLSNANLYELPFILALVRTLRSGSVDRTAFTESDVQFRIQGDHIYFDKLDLLGDGIALKGVGEMSGRQDLDLDFYTILGKRNAYLNSIRPVLGIASRRFLLINVTGTVSDPIMTREVLPGLNDTLEQLFPEAADTTEPPSGPMAKTRPGSGTKRR